MHFAKLCFRVVGLVVVAGLRFVDIWTATNTKYTVAVDANNIVTVAATSAENGVVIQVSR